MPKLIIKGHTDKPMVFFLKTGTVRVGRGEHCELRLPNVSVSREHCRIHVMGQAAHLEDLGSQNGILLDGEPCKEATLQRGSEIAVGRYRLVFLGDSRDDRFFNGHFVGYLPAYDPNAAARAGASSDADQAATFALDAAALRKMAEGGHLIDSARIVDANNDSRFWRPGDKRLSFGGSAAMINTRGWFTWGIVAEVTYEGGRHWLHSKAMLVSSAVGTEQVNDKRPLKHGDRIRIGSSRFIYDAPPLRKKPKGDAKPRTSVKDLLSRASLDQARDEVGAAPRAPSPPRPPGASPRRPVRPPSVPPSPSRARPGAAPSVPPPPRPGKKDE